MGNQTTSRVSSYSLMDPKVMSDPYEFYEVLQQEQPVYQMPETGMYFVTRYESVRQILTHPDVFSNDTSLAANKALQSENAEIYQAVLAEKGWGHIQTLQRTDPPVHGRYRKLLDRVFTASRVKELGPRVDNISEELIGNFADRGSCEFVAEYAMPFPGIVIAEQLGLDRSKITTFKRWGDAMLAMATKIMTEEETRATAEIELEAQHFLAEIFEDRRATPQDDLISALVHAHGDDMEPLTIHELQSLMHQLITGGFETTQSAIAHAVWLLVRQPELQEQLYGDPPKIKKFVEESLRWESPVQGLFRVTKTDVELDGTTIPAGSYVIVRYAAANRDAAKFKCPHQFDLNRKNAGAHLAFGSGPHFCVGAMLARREMVTAIGSLISRLKNIALAKPLPEPVHEFSLLFSPIAKMELQFEKRY
ncbi:MAG: cytochrome P450 [Erythrobacter sp.]